MAASHAARISSPTEDPLAGKLEYVILSVLTHYKGQYEDSLQNWYLSLKLAFPRLESPDKIRDAFQQLWLQGIIQLKKPHTGYYFGTVKDNVQFFATDQFKATLTAQGVDRWNLLSGASPANALSQQLALY